MDTPWYFIQLSDPHIVADTSQEFHGVNTYTTLSRALAQIRVLDPPPTFVILTGDLINDTEPQSYRVVKDLTDTLTVPTYFAMGNHDLRQPFREVILGETAPSAAPYYYTFDVAQHRCIVLDSLVEGAISGTLDATQLAWLDTTLAAAPQRPTLLFIHHPPVPTGIAWLDGYGLTNSAAFLAVVTRHPQIQRVFCGHVHMPLHITSHGLQCTSIPSTCYQFGDQVVTPKVVASPPGYGLVTVYGTHLISRVRYF